MRDEERLEKLIPNWRTNPSKILHYLDRQQTIIKQLQEETDYDNKSNWALQIISTTMGDLLDCGSEEDVILAAKILAKDWRAFTELYQGCGNQRPTGRRKQKRGSKCKRKPEPDWNLGDGNRSYHNPTGE